MVIESSSEEEELDEDEDQEFSDSDFTSFSGVGKNKRYLPIHDYASLLKEET